MPMETESHPKDFLICVVDNDSDARLSIRTLLESAAFTVQDYGSAKAFLFDDAFGASCLVADMCISDMNGMALQQEVSRRRTDLPVVLFSGRCEVRLAVQAMKAGAVDFIEKPFDRATFLACVRRAVAIGERARSQTAEAKTAKERLSQLTPREIQVLDELVGGMSNRITAQKLNISSRTIEIYRARIMDKLSANNVSDLVRTAVAGKP